MTRRANAGASELYCGIVVDREVGLANLFTGPLRQAVLDRQLRGTINIIGLRLSFLVPTGNSTKPFATTIGGTVSLEGVDVLLKEIWPTQQEVDAATQQILARLEELTARSGGGAATPAPGGPSS